MNTILRHVIGIDVAQDELVVCSGQLLSDLSVEFTGTRTFTNSLQGFTSLVEWAAKKAPASRFVMEATGVYHESLAYFLADHDYRVSIILPNKISNYFRTLEVKTINDHTAAEAITRFGLERNLDDWQAPRGIYRTLRQLTRERDQVIETRTMGKNQLHAEQSQARPLKGSVKRTKQRIDFLDKQENQILAELRELIKEDPEMQKLIVLLCSITGIGMLTAATILGETNGFDLIRNKKQLVSYAGLDVREKQSGTSIKGKPRISKKGNKYLRKAMHFPALSAIRHDERYKAIYARHVSKHGIKMKAAVAVQRKLLELVYSIFKTQQPYEQDYLQKTREQQIATP
jgi:transposase